MDEQLPEGTSRNFCSFLMRDSQVVQDSIIDSMFLEQEIYHRRNHVVLVSFVGQAPELHGGWLRELQDLLAPGKILLHKEARWGFSYICVDSLATTRQVLALTSHFQSWIPGFDPRKPVGMTVLVWITFNYFHLNIWNFLKP